MYKTNIKGLEREDGKAHKNSVFYLFFSLQVVFRGGIYCILY